MRVLNNPIPSKSSAHSLRRCLLFAMNTHSAPTFRRACNSMEHSSSNYLTVNPFTVRTICIHRRFYMLIRFPMDFIIKDATRFDMRITGRIFSRHSPWQNFNVLSIYVALFCFYYFFGRTWFFLWCHKLTWINCDLYDVSVTSPWHCICELMLWDSYDITVMSTLAHVLT